MAGDVVDGDGLEEELGSVVVPDDDGAGDALLLDVPVEGDVVGGIAVGHWGQVHHPVLNALLMTHQTTDRKSVV